MIAASRESGFILHKNLEMCLTMQHQGGCAAFEKVAEAQLPDNPTHRHAGAF